MNLNEAKRVLLSISKPAEDPSAQVLDHQFIKYARAEAAEMESVPSIEEVRERLSKIQGCSFSIPTYLQDAITQRSIQK